jgi:hypothetical protein
VRAYVYRWSVRPEEGLILDIRVTAPNVVVARREVRRFLVDHDGASWTVECVTRETTRALHVPRVIPHALRS